MLLERYLSRPIASRDRVTAREVINGTECVVVLEQDMFGRYCERSVSPLQAASASAGALPSRRAGWFAGVR